MSEHLSKQLEIAQKVIEQLRAGLDTEITRSQAANGMLSEVYNANLQLRTGLLISKKQNDESTAQLNALKATLVELTADRDRLNRVVQAMDVELTSLRGSQNEAA